MSVAFVFQGGGSLAASHVGMLRALTETGIQPDFVVGTSAGAINAVSFAADTSPGGVEHLAHLWQSIHRKDIFPISTRLLLGGVAGRRDGIVSNAPLRRLLRHHLTVRLLEEAAIPAHVVATDLATGDPVVLSGGDAATALLATCALPGIFPPVPVSNRLLIDGGVAADTPILQAEALGATVSYVLPSIGPADPKLSPHGALPVLLRALAQVLGRASITDIGAACGQVVVLPAPSAGVANPFDFGRTRMLIEEGYELACGWLDRNHAAVHSSNAVHSNAVHSSNDRGRHSHGDHHRDRGGDVTAGASDGDMLGSDGGGAAA